MGRPKKTVQGSEAILQRSSGYGIQYGKNQER